MDSISHSNMQWTEFVDQVPELCSRVQEYISQLDTSDVRYLMLNAMQDEYASSLWVIAGALHITNSQNSVDDFLRLVDQGADKTKIQLVFTDFVRKSIITRVYFLLDHLLRSLAFHTSGKSAQSVYKNAEKLIENLNVSSSDKSTFEAMGHTRNAFHNNGKHIKPSETYQIDGRHFQFSQGVNVSLEWRDIKTLIHSCIMICIAWSSKIDASTVVQEF